MSLKKLASYIRQVSPISWAYKLAKKAQTEHGPTGKHITSGKQEKIAVAPKDKYEKLALVPGITAKDIRLFRDLDAREKRIAALDEELRKNCEEMSALSERIVKKYNIKADTVAPNS
jgi:hypothetical protein